MSQPRIVAIVLSFNRPEMVERCVQSLRAQTRPLDSILVVDGSTTGDVRAWLDAQKDVTAMYIENLGSAGACHHGFRRALNQGMDWLWVMDDDVVTAPDALQELVRAMSLRPEARILNSYSTAQDDPTIPAVGAISWRKNADDFLHGENLYSTAQVLSHADADGFLNSAGGQFWQGTLYHRSVIECVGSPCVPLFTRGDEVEYGLRIMRAGYQIYTYVPSRVTHPRNQILFINVFGKKLPFGGMNHKQRYYSLRNSMYIRKEYFGGLTWSYVLRRFMSGVMAELYWNRSLGWREQVKGCLVVARAVRDGVRYRVE